MTFTLGLGWWLLPAAVTLTSLVIAWIAVGRLPAPSRGDYSAIGNAALGLVVLAYGAAAAIVSLIAWLTWALVF